jgi:hypothetical protein
MSLDLLGTKADSDTLIRAEIGQTDRSASIFGTLENPADELDPVLDCKVSFLFTNTVEFKRLNVELTG